MANGFCEVMTRGVAAEQLPENGRQRPTVNLTVTLDTLLQLPGSEDLLHQLGNNPRVAGTIPRLERFGPVPVSTAQRLACDGLLTRIVLDPHTGNVLDAGRTQRLTNTSQDKALSVLHTTCAFPGCHIPIRWCQIHHLHWWSNGGPTDLDNLTPYCRAHHRYVHELGYTTTRQTRTLIHRDPHGRIIPNPQPHQHPAIHQLILATHPDPPDTS